MRITIPLLLLALTGASGCSVDDLGCRVDSECGDGQACANGQCYPHRTLSGPTPDLGGADGGAQGDLAQPGPPDGFSPDALTAGCPFNNDGVIQRAEIPVMPGLGGFFEATPSGQTATVNVVKSNGVWDYSAVGAGDQKVFDGLSSPTGTWWASSFPTATYAQLLDAGSGLIGVYKVSDTALTLLGAVSATGGVSSTNLSYNPPIDVLRFPLSSTSTWTTTSTVSGTYQGVYFYATQTWAFKVDDSGTAKTPAADFQVLRLRVDYEQDYGFSVTKQITYLYLAECYGEVTRIRSQDNETAADFTMASEYRRLAAP